MRLEDLFAPRRRHDTIDTLLAHIGDLRRQTRHVGRNVSHNAHSVAEDFGDAMSDLSHQAARQGAWLAGIASRKAVDSARAVKRDPLPAIAVLGTALLLTSLMTRRR